VYRLPIITLARYQSKVEIILLLKFLWIMSDICVVYWWWVVQSYTMKSLLIYDSYWLGMCDLYHTIKRSMYYLSVVMCTIEKKCVYIGVCPCHVWNQAFYNFHPLNFLEGNSCGSTHDEMSWTCTHCRTSDGAKVQYRKLARYFWTSKQQDQ